VANVLQCAYIDHAQDNPRVPMSAGIVPTLLTRVMPVHEAVVVEYYLPGCPPSADHIKALLTQLLGGSTPHLEGKQIKFG
jgi:NAD-reducing hydrogenase small subunit